jgi:hypothetical protein
MEIAGLILAVILVGIVVYYTNRLDHVERKRSH